MIQQTNPRAGFIAYKQEIMSAMNRVLDSGRYILDEELDSFENEFSKYLNIDYSIGVASGTDSILLALKALDIGPGDYVITVSHTAVATAAAIVQSGAEVVFVDIDTNRYTMMPESLEEALRNINIDRVKAIIPVHIYGQPADMSYIMEIAKRYDLKIIEDCCQAHGAEINGKKVGTYGELGCFSFYPTKNLGALGDAGMVVTSNNTLNNRIRLLRQYGWKERNNSLTYGINSRLDELQAAILRIKLKHLDLMNARRKIIADLYTELLFVSNLRLPITFNNLNHVFHQYVIQSDKRDMLINFLKKNGIGTLIHYPIPIHMQPAFKKASIRPVSLKNTEKISSQILSLPMYPELTDKEVTVICDSILKFN